MTVVISLKEFQKIGLQISTNLITVIGYWIDIYDSVLCS